MSSSVFFKFKSQKEPSRVTFDGTGISVFELKREIITINKLGDGTDFDLAIYNEDSNEEYDEDTTIIPRSTSITARRLPPAKPGRGTAQRYVSGKMPTVALNAGRIEKPRAVAQPSSRNPEQMMPRPTGTQSEEDRIAAMFAASSEQWSQTQEQMASATPIFRPGQPQNFKKGANTAPVPSHPPPNGYICYRCGEKGHWIQQCPTNADPNFDGRPRVKRTTGIPRSFLKTVEKPVASSDDENGGTNPSSVMVNAEGEYVVAVADKASWESYQQKTAKSNAQATESSAESKEIQEKGLACPIDHKLFKDATKTPCCSKTYCEECIQSALLDSDFVCPNCDTKDIYLDHLKPDEEMREKVQEFSNERKDIRERSKSKSPSKSPNVAPSVAVKNGTPQPPTNQTTSTSVELVRGKKRPAEEDMNSDRLGGPVNTTKTLNSNEMQRVASSGSNTNSVTHTLSPQPPNAALSNFNNGLSANFNGPQNNGFNNMNMSNNMMNQNMNMGMPMSSMNGNAYQNSGFMPNNIMNGQPGYNQMMGMNQGMGNMNGMGMNMGMGMGMAPMGGMMDGFGVQAGYQHMMPNMHHQNQYNNNNNMNMNQYQQQQQQQQQGYGGNNMQSYQQQQHQQQLQIQLQQQQQMMGMNGGFANQQRTVFSEPFPNEEDSAYMRKPVNPHRHLRMKRIRPSDFKPLGE